MRQKMSVAKRQRKKKKKGDLKVIKPKAWIEETTKSHNKKKRIHRNLWAQKEVYCLCLWGRLMWIKIKKQNNNNNNKKKNI